MAAAHSGKLQSSPEIQETLELLLGILPNTHQLTELLEAETKKLGIRTRNLVKHFQTATYLLHEHLGKLQNPSLVENGADVIHWAALCLEKIASPKIVPETLQENSYTNLQAVHCLTNEAKKRFFYQRLKIIESDLGREVLQTLKQCVDKLSHASVPDTGEDFVQYANDFDDVWTSIQNAYHALVACTCETSHTEDIHEMTLQIVTKLKQDELHSNYNLNILIPGANIVDSNELNFSVTNELKSMPRIKLDSSRVHRQQERICSRKEITCSYSAWTENPNPSFFRANFALEGNQLWELGLSRRKILLDEQYEQISLGDLIESKIADWPYVVKLILAVTLAHSLVYLNDGPWLNGSWSRSKIVFYKSRAFVSARPFLRTKITKVAKVHSDVRSDFHQYPGILDFGIALLEIHLGKRIDEPSTTTSHRWGIASQVLEQQRYYMQDNYRNAVVACLQPDFGIEIGLSPQQFRKQIFDKIVSPLKKEFENGFKDTIEPSLLDEAATKINLISGLFSDFSSVQKPPTFVPTNPPPRPRKLAMQRLESAIYMKTDVVAPGTMIENPLTTAKSRSFCLFEDENQPQDIPEEQCRQTDAWIYRFKELVKLKLDSNFTNENRITVAILDSGIDMENTDIDAQSDRIKDIRSWVDGKAGVKAKRGGDLSGHGTHIAGIILNLAPNVDIYIARVTKTRELDDPEQVLKAFEYSWKTWNVDMITMSFGFQENIREIRNEIREAVHKGKIVFAAASNDGGNSPRAFPASQKGVICVHSTDSNGNRSKYNPSPKQRMDNFSILGQYIESCWPNTNKAGASRRMTGTSFAAPVAVALAAFIIGYIQQEIPNLSTLTEPKSYDGIVSLFHLFVNSNGGPRDGYDWIAPFEFFHRFQPNKIREDIKDALNP